MRFTALALATLLALGVTVSAVQRAHAQDIEIEDAGDEDLGDLGSRRPGQKRKPEEPEKIWGNKGLYGIVAGTYAAEDLGQIKTEVEDVPNTPDTDVDFSNSLGFNLRAGYRWHPRIATELEYEWLDSFHLEDATASDVKYDDVWSLTVNGKAFLSTGRFEPFAIFGLGYYRIGDMSEKNVNTSMNATGDFGMKAGAGFELYLTDRMALTVEGTYNFGESHVAELRYTSFSWGVMYRP